jgi:hypothetical protein
MAGMTSAAVLIAAFAAVSGCCAVLVVRLCRPRSPGGPRPPGEA